MKPFNRILAAGLALAAVLATPGSDARQRFIYKGVACAHATPDSATSPNIATLFGFQFPDLVPAPAFNGGNANAFHFSGADYAANTNAINWGNSSTGTPGVSGVGVAATFDLEGEIKTAESIVVGVLSGRGSSGGAAGGLQPFVYIDGTHLVCSVRDNGGTQRSLTGTTAFAINTVYTYAYDYDGTTQRCWLSTAGGLANLEASGAISGVEAGNGTDRFFIGRYDVSSGNLPFKGIHGRLRWSNVSRHVAAYTPSTANSFTNDANTLGLLQNTATSCQ
jgi:hypothetical protein